MLCQAYELCLKNKKKKLGTYNFTNEELCQNLIKLMDELNNRTYSPQPSNCYVITDPALREIYAAQFSDRIVQHFYMKELEEIHQTINKKKTKIDTAYHGVPFLGKVSYPYGYQKPSKQVIIRVNQKAKNLEYKDKANLLAKTNSQIGTLKNYNCYKLILNYENVLPREAKKIIKYNELECKFTKVEINF